MAHMTVRTTKRLRFSEKSKVATPRIFRENKKRKMIADSYTLNRVAEIAGEFDARGPVPPHLYTKDAPTARRIFDDLCKTTFATVSEDKPTCPDPARRSVLTLEGLFRSVIDCSTQSHFFDGVNLKPCRQSPKAS
jgi:hypothetical protein